jgi:ankyrin repeat protein
LHFAAKRDNVDLIKLLIRYKADVNAKDLNGRTPLYHAAMMNNVNAVSVLLSNMCNVFAMDKDGTKIEETTDHPEIQKMINKGKSVRNTYDIFVVPGCNEIRPVRKAVR